MLAPRKGLFATGEIKDPRNMHSRIQEMLVIALDSKPNYPVTVKLWESPGRAGGLPMINYITIFICPPAIGHKKLSMENKRANGSC